MTNPADQARRALGLPTTGHLDPHATMGSTSPIGRLGLVDVLRRASSKTDAPATGLGGLTRWSWGATALAFVIAATYRWVSEFAAGTSVGPISSWVTALLSVAHAPVWVPWASGAVGAVLVGLAFATSGFTRATREQIIAMTAASVIAAVLAVPVVVALAAGLLVIALVVLLVLLALAAVIAVLAIS